MKRQLSNRTLNQRLKRLYYALFVLTIGIGSGNVLYLFYQPTTTVNALVFCILQYVVILAILTLPIVLRRRFMIQIPLMITVVCGLFGFVAMVMGDGLNFYGKYSWWDSVLHLFSGSVLAFVGLWIITIIFAKQDQLVLSNKFFLSLYVLIFGLSCGAVWEVCEYAYDAFCGTNTQQFMATTTASITTAEDIPLCGHDALRDTMTDLIFDLVGSLFMSVYIFFRYDKLIAMYKINKV